MWAGGRWMSQDPQLRASYDEEMLYSSAQLIKMLPLHIRKAKLNVVPRLTWHKHPMITPRLVSAEQHQQQLNQHIESSA